ncbi:hypothetical protein [Sphingomonas sp.]
MILFFSTSRLLTGSAVAAGEVALDDAGDMVVASLFLRNFAGKRRSW